MLAIVHATLRLTFDDGVIVETVPVTFVVRSRADVAINKKLGDGTDELAAKLKSLPGRKSPAALALMKLAE